MSTAVADVLKAAVASSLEQQREVIDALENRLPDDDISEFDPEFIAELYRRSDEIDAGTAKYHTWTEVQALLEKDRLKDV